MRSLIISSLLILICFQTQAKKTPPTQEQAQKASGAQVYIVENKYTTAVTNLQTAVKEFWPWPTEVILVEEAKLSDLMSSPDDKIIFHYTIHNTKRTNMSELPLSYNQDEWGSDRDVIRKYERYTYDVPLVKVILNNNEYVISRMMDKFKPTTGELASIVQHAGNEYKYALEHPVGKKKYDDDLKAFVKDLKKPALWVDRSDIANDIMVEKKMAKAYPKDIFVAGPKKLDEAILAKKENMMYVVSVPVNDVINEYYLVRASDGWLIAIGNGNHLISPSVIKQLWKKMLKLNAE